MPKFRPLILKDGKKVVLNRGVDTLDDFLSGFDTVELGETFILKEGEQTINFTQYNLDGDLDLGGDLWLA